MSPRGIGKLKKVVVTSVRSLPLSQLREVLDFVLFLKTRSKIDPAQAYFWTKKWQSLERSAERDKKLGRIVGDGAVENLLKSLHQ